MLDMILNCYQLCRYDCGMFVIKFMKSTTIIGDPTAMVPTIIYFLLVWNKLMSYKS